jgi:hypothetical protein
MRSGWRDRFLVFGGSCAGIGIFELGEGEPVEGILGMLIGALVLGTIAVFDPPRSRPAR